MNERTAETLGILQEECAEVIVEVSKCRRFGLDSVHYKTGEQHSAMLEMEIGDVLAMVDILVDQGIIDRSRLSEAIERKKEKLKKWSNIYGKD
jgi:NTP pyrophosphatase (non-canonical NTP hydrolase)